MSSPPAARTRSKAWDLIREATTPVPTQPAADESIPLPAQPAALAGAIPLMDMSAIDAKTEEPGEPISSEPLALHTAVVW